MEVPKNEVILLPEQAPKKARVRSKRPAKTEAGPFQLKDAKENIIQPAAVKMDQRTLTAQSGRRTRLPKTGEGAVPLSEVDYTVIKDTKDPLAVRDQLMREYFASHKHTDELVQKLCALVFKHH
jgi:hypothetical protein